MKVTAHGRLTLLSTSALAGLFGFCATIAAEPAPNPGRAAVETTSKVAKDPPLPRPRPNNSNAPSAAPKDKPTPAATVTPPPAPEPLPAGATLTELPPLTDLNAVRQAIDLIRHGKHKDALELARGMKDPVATKVIEWLYLRADDNNASFDRYSAFIANNPDWPSIWFFHRRAEAMLWQERREASTVRAFFRGSKPLTAKGKFALARALASQGERQEAEELVRDAWRNDPFTPDVEAAAYDLFEKYLTREDHKIRMDRRLTVEDIDAGMRAAGRLNGVDLAIARARVAVIRKENNAATLLDGVPTSARNDPGYIFSRVQLLRRQKKIAEAGALILTAHDPNINNADEWWMERRLLARDLLDIGDFKTAYSVCRDAIPPNRGNYRVEQPFMAGWIALRFLHDPKLALEHFNKVALDTDNPVAKARAAYWRGRAAEALGHQAEARSHYEEASQFPTAYYGQIASTKINRSEMVLQPAPALASEERSKFLKNEVVRADELLYHVGERDLAAIMAADAGEYSDDVRKMAMIGELAAHYQDGRSMLLVGRAAHARGLPFDVYAFPTVGMPRYEPLGPPLDIAVLYSIARQESGFNPKTVSTANALGLMQVTPAAGKDVTARYKVPFDQNRLLKDTVYNTQVGAAELADDLKDYRGSYILAFVAYNAGRGRAKEWIAKYGDPRDPKVDPIDWVERIPLSETRNYVQRILENLQIYRMRFGGGTRMMIEADLRRGGSGGIH
ncbi:MAG TPA: lytic transglycosylase domain-containing protein [Xanthobacteraceae bacterium]|nr:lytic transglycosylase domain-containing protein [Xanthobacteraceae bacterium]